MAFFAIKKGTYTLLDFPRANLTEAIGINDDGQVVGDYRDSSGRFHGFFWDAGLFLTFDVPFPEATTTGPSGINNVGQIVGFYLDNNVSDSFPNGHVHGFLYDNGFFSSFDVPGASGGTLAFDINDHGQIVGVYGDSDFVPHGFLLEEGRFTTIEVPFPHVVITEVSGINNRGQIVGSYRTTNPADVNNSFYHGLIATPVAGRPSSTAQLAASSAPTVARADGVATPAFRLSLDACPGVEPQDGSVIPAKLLGRWILCSQAVVPE
jgi:probable HAF family extracellular repeat protein